MTMLSSAHDRCILLSVLSLFAILLPGNNAIARGTPGDTTNVPITRVFYRMDRNIVGSFTRDYGLNYIIAGAATYGIVKSGFDWRWYRNAQEHPWIPSAGFVAVGVGPLASVFVPVGVYLYGRSKDDAALQMTGLALGQAAIVSGLITTGIKAFTGRGGPDEHGKLTDYSDNFRFGFLRGGVYEGWPSGHTTSAFAMATTLIELYPDNATIRYCSLAYASLIGLGVSTNIHWFSDAVAGVLVGYAIGATVGESYRDLMDGSTEEGKFGLSITPTRIGFVYRF